MLGAHQGIQEPSNSRMETPGRACSSEGAEWRPQHSGVRISLSVTVILRSFSRASDDTVYGFGSHVECAASVIYSPHDQELFTVISTGTTPRRARNNILLLRTLSLGQRGGRLGTHSEGPWDLMGCWESEPGELHARRPPALDYLSGLLK